jgi:hypothetical protein
MDCDRTMLATAVWLAVVRDVQGAAAAPRAGEGPVPIGDPPDDDEGADEDEDDDEDDEDEDDEEDTIWTGPSAVPPGFAARPTGRGCTGAGARRTATGPRPDAIR